MGGYVPNTEKERQEMLQAAGYSDMDDLFADIPEEVRLKGELEIPAGMPELSVRREMEKMAGKNQLFLPFSGVPERTGTISRQLSQTSHPRKIL